ncbi:GNAT family N-acetyltransferase [Amycolatopsis pithecellobii]|uniref:GNAT family N-acetyltransferase n=1 Tax=Amycolatopsis pithecellobii TaxID=664692 RepID=A0A6N7Z640_9PSEU|nr:GNAT family protein [Amycolatopsis pithecellobii]MTD56254.1 GNAT family N-acetyltransferase [Amycolatopsis pithecellobii]
MLRVPLGDDGAELRLLEPYQAVEFIALVDRGREFIGRYLRFPDTVTDLASGRSFLQDFADKTAADTGRIYGIWLAGQLVGSVIFAMIDAGTGIAEAGCWLEPSAAGKGLVTRAARAIIDWAINERGIHRVEWRAAVANEASIAVAKRLGMTREGVLREYYLHRGTRFDVEVWSILAPEWKAAGA